MERVIGRPGVNALTGRGPSKAQPRLTSGIGGKSEHEHEHEHEHEEECSACSCSCSCSCSTLPPKAPSLVPTRVRVPRLWTPRPTAAPADRVPPERPATGLGSAAA